MSYTIHPTFEHYYQPETVEEALSLLDRCGKEARLLAGGTDLMNLMRNRAVAPSCVIDISRVSGLADITVAPSGDLRIGAMAALKAVAGSAVVVEGWPLLREAILQMGMTQLRNMGTVAGNICRASPSADSAPALLVLEARVEVRGSGGSREVPVGRFFAGPGQTVLKSNEMVTAIRVPPLPAGTGTAFLKLARVAEDLAKVNVAVLLVRQNDVCQQARIALGGVAPTPIRAGKAEAVLRGKPPDDKLMAKAGVTAAGETSPISDVRSTADYRRELSRVLVSRAIGIAWGRASGKKGD